MKLFDAHCHLQAEGILDTLDAVMERAHAAGVAGMVCCGTTPADWGHVLDIAERFSDVMPAAGFHPVYLNEAPEGWELKLKEILGIKTHILGEIGLDGTAECPDRSIQEQVLEKQMALAAGNCGTAVLHCRRAWPWALEFIKEYGTHGLRPVFHSYSGGIRFIPELTALGAYFSFSGTLTLSRNWRAHESAKAVPADRLLIETDTPDLMPVIEGRLNTGVQNEPANLKHILFTLAGLRGEQPEKLADIIWENSMRAFRDR